jgi:hypothetical protein
MAHLLFAERLKRNLREANGKVVMLDAGPAVDREVNLLR